MIGLPLLAFIILSVPFHPILIIGIMLISSWKIFFVLNFRGGLAKCILVDGSNKIVDQCLILLDSGL